MGMLSLRIMGYYPEHAPSLDGSRELGPVLSSAWMMECRVSVSAAAKAIFSSKSKKLDKYFNMKYKYVYYIHGISY